MIITSSVYTAIIVEPREHPALEFVLDNFMTNLDENWNFIIFHGNVNEMFVKNILLHKFPDKLHRIKMVNLKIDNLSIADYNKLFYSKLFYEYIPTEIFLVFQTDSAICSTFRNQLYQFLKYDYVGAPWKFHQAVGNGGLSLRKKSKMLEILNKCPVQLSRNEDLYFSFGCKEVNIYKPDYTTAQSFSVEGVYQDIPSFGFHKPWLSLQPQEYQNFKEICPEVQTVQSLQR